MAKLRQLGAVAGEPTDTVICKVQGGKVLCSKWVVNGGLGPVIFNPYRVSGNRGVELELECSDLSRFSFPSVSRLREGTMDTVDTAVIKDILSSNRTMDDSA